MLVLSRRESQTVKIGSDVEVRIIRSRNGIVRLGIVAPKAIPICRPETKKPG